jgi:hypothetical protein
MERLLTSGRIHLLYVLGWKMAISQYLGRCGNKLKLTERFRIVSRHQPHYLGWPDYVHLAVLISSMRWLQDYHTVSS